MKTVIITGASSGLGREFFIAASKVFPGDEFWLAARRRDRLCETAELAPGVKTRLIECDLAADEGLEYFRGLLDAEKPETDLFINNAGFGKLGNVEEVPPSAQRDMVSLNCGTLTALCAMAIPYMAKGGSIINVSSIASFAPTPRMTTYSATKAYVTAFSKGLREELKPKKINVTAVCPGPMHTEFMKVADITDANSKTFSTLPYCDARDVAEKSVKKALAGKAVYTNRMTYKFYRVLAKLLPHNIMMKMSKC